uniref:Putative ovule protein n=1 Tax=Solanum chacoense TaxID=4108 RepID=A0A0V0HSB1_SOLCH
MEVTTPSFLFLGILSSSIATPGSLFCCFLCSLLLQSFRIPFTALLRSQTIIGSLLAFASTSCSSFPILFPLISASDSVKVTQKYTNPNQKNTIKLKKLEVDLLKFSTHKVSHKKLPRLTP